MTIKELLERIEIIRDGLQDTDGMCRWGIDGACDDMSVLMDDIQSDGVSNQHMSIH